MPLFDDLPVGAIQHLSELGFGRGFLTASLRARLRKAGFRDLGHLAGSSPDAIARVRKFGPIRVAWIRAFILDAIARHSPGARAMHTPEATRARRLQQLRGAPVGRLLPEADWVAAFGVAGGSCADLAGRSRRELLGTGLLTPGDVDGIVTALAGLLEAGRAITPPPAAPATEAPAEVLAAHRAAQLAERDREWEDAAPPTDRRRRGQSDAL